MGLIDAIAKFADPYDRQARLYPALLALLPLVVTSLIIVGDAASMLGTAAMAAIACGALYWMAGMARDKGKALEPGLFTAWGGKPSVQLLRHRNGAIDAVTKARLHRFLEVRLGVAIPTHDAEVRAPADADRLYESATRWLLEQTRDSGKHGLLITENISYGFRRNMLGMRRVGLALTVLSALLLYADGGWHAPSAWTNIIGSLLAVPSKHRVGLLACLASGVVWTLGVSKARVRAAAFAYAERLVTSCEVLADGVHASDTARSARADAATRP
jgi:hypothetical protein